MSISRISDDVGIPIQSLRLVLRRLEGNGLVERHGANKGTWYRARLK